jgi:hypothetical protein
MMANAPSDMRTLGDLLRRCRAVVIKVVGHGNPWLGFWCCCTIIARSAIAFPRTQNPGRFPGDIKFVGNPPSNLARGPISDQVGMAATGGLYTPPDIIKRQAMRANLLARATATNFGGFRSSSEASHGVGL